MYASITDNSRGRGGVYLYRGILKGGLVLKDTPLSYIFTTQGSKGIRQLMYIPKDDTQNTPSVA